MPLQCPQTTKQAAIDGGRTPDHELGSKIVPRLDVVSSGAQPSINACEAALCMVEFQFFLEAIPYRVRLDRVFADTLGLEPGRGHEATQGRARALGLPFTARSYAAQGEEFALGEDGHRQ